MRKAFLILLCSICTRVLFAQTHVTIIGTAHSQTPKFSPDSILNVLNKIKPDVILMELDTSLMDDKGNYKLGQMGGNEAIATRNYKAEHGDLIVRRFDLENRNAYYTTHNTFALERKLGHTIDSIYHYKGFSAADKQKIDSVYHMYQEDNRMSQLDIYTMNSKAFMDMSAKKQYWMYVKELEVVGNNPALKPYYDFYKDDGEFWIRRNKRMTENIIGYVNEFKGKKIVVLTGATHKYILTDNLKPLQSKQHFKLLDLPR